MKCVIVAQDRDERDDRACCGVTTRNFLIDHEQEERATRSTNNIAATSKHESLLLDIQLLEADMRGKSRVTRRQ